MHAYTRILRYTKYGLQTRQIIMIGQRKPEKNAPYEWFKLPCGHSSGSLPLSLPKCLSICTVLFFLINTSLASLLSVFVEILFCKVQGPGPLSLTTGLVARIWCSHHHDPAQSLVGNQAPRSVIAGQGHPISVLQFEDSNSKTLGVVRHSHSKTYEQFSQNNWF